MPRETTAVCPKCQQTTKALIWASINVGVNPEMKERLQSGALFQQHCTQCGHAFHALYDTLYHDPEKPLMVWLKHYRHGRVVTMESAPLEHTEERLAFYHLRLVTSLRQLCDKIRVFDDGLDDRVVEFMKSVYWSTLYQGREYDDDLIVYAGIQSHYGKNLLAFHHWAPDGQVSASAVEMETYEGTAERILPLLPPLTTGKWELINHRYVMEIQKRT